MNLYAKRKKIVILQIIKFYIMGIAFFLFWIFCMIILWNIDPILFVASIIIGVLAFFAVRYEKKQE